MQKPPISKYRPFPPVDLKDRRWPDRTITKAPIWCSVDLRDGNQALAIPMDVDDKLEFFELLVRIGFKEIEVGFPSASQIEFDLLRRLIDENRIPADVTVQVLTQSREDLITRSFEALRGAKRAIVHLYNSTSPAQRRFVFGMDKPDIIRIATSGTALIKKLARETKGTEIQLEYSPESFTSTEMAFARDICEAVMDVWEPTPQRKVILNLPATVEYATPNIHADQIEWMCRNLSRPDSRLISLHTHNDRGTGTAATELGLMAGADRVEGTLFGNGERTGNLDIVTTALNMYVQGVHPGLDFSSLPAIRQVYERCTGMEVHPRHPYAGELVFTAFSGSHQDAIKKSWSQQKPDEPWEVLYIPLDPADIGRTYKAIIRINAQSGKGGVAYVMEKEFGFQLPKAMHKEFGRVINDLADRKKTEITPAEINEAFMAEYINRESPYRLEAFRAAMKHPQVTCDATINIKGETRKLHGTGNGPIDAFFHAMSTAGIPKFEFVSYSEHSMRSGADSLAVSYVEIRRPDGRTFFGAGIAPNIELAPIKAVISALNRAS